MQVLLPGVVILIDSIYALLFVGIGGYWYLPWVVIPAEENFLQTQFGSEYSAYVASTPRYFEHAENIVYFLGTSILVIHFIEFFFFKKRFEKASQRKLSGGPSLLVSFYYTMLFGGFYVTSDYVCNNKKTTKKK